MNAIEIKNLSKHYKNFTLDNLNLTLPSGCVMGLIGRNGAGKTTTMKLLIDAIVPSNGRITILVKDNRNFKIKEDIGIVLDDTGFCEAFKAKQINTFFKLSYKNWDEKYFYEMLDRLSVPTDTKFAEMSRGTKTKLLIAAALSHKPKLLILDEPTSGLDPVIRDEIMDIFTDFTRDDNHSILISSHIVSDLEKICDYIAFLDNGKLMLCEEKDRLCEEYKIIQCSKEQLSEIGRDKIVGSKVSKYSAQAILRQEDIPRGFEAMPVSIEELFLYMVKEEK